MTQLNRRSGWLRSIRSIRPRPPAGIVLALTAVFTVGALWATESDGSGEMAATAGVPAGYVADRACAGCHRELFESYQEVGMARSFYRPRPERMIEDFAAEPLFHTASNRYYEIRRDGDRLRFRRYQRDAGGAEINPWEREVDWVLGSGNRSRTYLYQTPSGEIFQLPLAWYTRSESWGMAPGYDRTEHEGVGRRVRRECMFCHNAYPEVPAGSDHAWASQIFPFELPEGTGCQRCHGPGAEHVRLALSGGVLEGPLLTSIVNPAKLDPERRDAVCFGCHLQPSVALFGVRRFDRGDYSFRPGQALTDYIVQVDVTDRGLPRADRFEINHHPYRLRQSRCYTESGADLSCLTCHDPHRKVPPEERSAHYRAACLGCHEVADPASHAQSAGPAAAGIEADDCVACHMPQRRTQDVVRVAMTDHRIARGPFGPELVAPRAEADPEVVAVELVEPDAVADPALGDVYRGLAAIRTSRNRWSVDFLERAVEVARPESPIPYLDLAGGQLNLKRYAEAERNLATVLDRMPGQPRAVEWLALVEASTGRLEEARIRLEGLITKSPGRPESHYNHGLVLRAQGRREAALEALARALELRPVFYHALLQRGEIFAELERHAEAAAELRAALAVDPQQTRAYLGLARSLRAAGDPGAASRWLRHGAEVATRPDPLLRELDEAPPGEASAPPG